MKDWRSRPGECGATVRRLGAPAAMFTWDMHGIIMQHHRNVKRITPSWHSKIAPPA